MTEFERIMQILWPLIAGFSLWGGFIWGVYVGRDQEREANRKLKAGEVERG